ncbi:hypothetical protein IAE35_12315 [Pseudomonas sp. S75]|uniref:hypothetical protein n=1 Tax=unclassified Pseudomonas TaxID=196821 RepID=UPI00190643CB|nr:MULTISPECIES: hypothetical protein [unclassified Pseudomonas]MBJ9977121.1 hypothetical protein [Pseudomonas sp. S30]MBK0154123.1 hypothetical protein [Pseudomonas sp. S75]
MSTLSTLAFILVAGCLLDWLCRSARLRDGVCVLFMIASVTSCTQLGDREILLLDGLDWTIFFALIGTRLLFERSALFEWRRR